MENSAKQPGSVAVRDMSLRRADFWIFTVSSVEQVIGTAMSALVGVMIPMINLLRPAPLPAFLQGLMGAIGLIGIGFGSALIGRLSDKQGYLNWFRACPLIIVAGSLVCYFGHASMLVLLCGLFLTGIGIGGGYSLDSAYISELMPRKWELTMVGAAKATCSIGFIGAAVAAWLVIHAHPHASVWPSLALILAAMGVVGALMRIRWWESPKWLIIHGRRAEAEQVVTKFLGPGVNLDCMAPAAQPAPAKKERLGAERVILSGIPWACEGLGVYGFGVFLPVLLMAIGLGGHAEGGILHVERSVEMTAVVNFFMLPGFVLGLLIMRKVNNIKMLTTGFYGSAAGLLLLLVGYLLHWPTWTLILGFIVFEFSLNAGPHLVTFVIPASIYPVAMRAEGQGVAAMLGKVGAVLGVLLMPMLLRWGGIPLVMSVSAGVMILGAVVGRVYAQKLGLY